jgi:hypothetical protein
MFHFFFSFLFVICLITRHFLYIIWVQITFFSLLLIRFSFQLHISYLIATKIKTGPYSFSFLLFFCFCFFWLVGLHNYKISWAGVGAWMQLNFEVFPFAILWVVRAPYEMTKISFRGLCHGYRKKWVILKDNVHDLSHGC